MKIRSSRHPPLAVLDREHCEHGSDPHKHRACITGAAWVLVSTNMAADSPGYVYFDPAGQPISEERYLELSDQGGDFFEKYSTSEKIGTYTVWTRWDGAFRAGARTNLNGLFVTSRYDHSDPHRGKDWAALTWEEALGNHSRVVGELKRRRRGTE